MFGVTNVCLLENRVRSSINFSGGLIVAVQRPLVLWVLTTRIFCCLWISLLLFLPWLLVIFQASFFFHPKIPFFLFHSSYSVSICLVYGLQTTVVVCLRCGPQYDHPCPSGHPFASNFLLTNKQMVHKCFVFFLSDKYICKQSTLSLSLINKPPKNCLLLIYIRLCLIAGYMTHGCDVSARTLTLPSEHRKPRGGRCLSQGILGNARVDPCICELETLHLQPRRHGIPLGPPPCLKHSGTFQLQIIVLWRCAEWFTNVLWSGWILVSDWLVGVLKLSKKNYKWIHYPTCVTRFSRSFYPVQIFLLDTHHSSR